jgi:glucose-1-phosphate adenylyltransferase
MRKTLAILLAGGVGSRLNILAHSRAKPAVPFGGIYRIIDFTLSNVVNSGLNHVAVLTQYKPLSLMDHIANGAAWDFIGRLHSAKILPPRTGQKDSDWYKGTADAVRQNLDYIHNHLPERVLILSGDHIYHMDYSRMVNFHKNQAADLTIAMMQVPKEMTHHFGIAVTNELGRLVEWQEKPKQAKSTLASMGIYVFNYDFLLYCLRHVPGNDFGHDVITKVMKSHRIFAFPFEGYWRDVGTLQAYWEASMDLLNPDSGLEIYRWSTYTNVEEEGRKGDRPSTRICRHANVKDSIISHGCVIEGEVQRSILSPGVHVRPGARVKDSVIMHDSLVGAGSVLDKVIVDKQARIGTGCEIGIGNEKIPNRAFPEHLSEGLTVIGKKAEVPDGSVIGKNCIIFPEVVAKDFAKRQVTDGETIGLRA